MPFWLQPYISLLPFQLAAMIPGTKERELQSNRRYVINTALALVNRERKRLGQPITYPVPDHYACGNVHEGSLINVMT